MPKQARAIKELAVIKPQVTEEVAADLIRQNRGWPTPFSAFVVELLEVYRLLKRPLTAEEVQQVVGEYCETCQSIEAAAENLKGEAAA